MTKKGSFSPPPRRKSLGNGNFEMRSPCPLLRSRKRPLVALFLRGLGYMLGLLLFLPELGQQPAQQSGEGTLGIGQGILGGWRTPGRERFGSRGINRIGHRVCLLRLVLRFSRDSSGADARHQESEHRSVFVSFQLLRGNRVL